MSHENKPNAPVQPATEASNLPKAYDPSIIEKRWAEYWVSEHLFDVPTSTKAPGAPSSRSEGGKSDAGNNEGVKSDANFTILLPPPNVTGRLHMGHMLNQTEMDILTRWHRMCGQTSLWVPGTDHAGIATQMMVERQLASEGTNRKALGREAFTERVWEWKHQYGSAITDQMRRLGASVDWSREYFTMDDHLNVAVKEAFVRLYEQGLIYRGSYIVNWDPIQQTAVSDLEVTHEDRLGKLYHIRYPFADGSGSIVVATTRPETMLGDTAVAVNPNDARYKDFIGKLVSLPLSGVNGAPNREIPILADDWAQPEFGTGAVKVTPAHDPNDFAIGQRHALLSITILDTSAHIDLPGSPYHGLDRFAAREKIVADLEAAGLLVAIKDHNHAIALSQRSGAVIEPRLSMQWFLAVNKTPAKPGTGAGAPGLDSETWDSEDPRGQSIAAKAKAAVGDGDGKIKFTPEMYSKTYFEWMNNIHDWCISRQLWWGHRIPAWHCSACHALTVSRETPTACGTCGSADITQETDVLDTWFSSGLLPFTVFGWPGTGTSLLSAPSTSSSSSDSASLLSSRSAAEGSASPLGLTPDLAQFYPTSLLVTGFDILFFWVARMIMLGTHFMLDVPMPDGTPRKLSEAVPFKEVYIHALVRDADRQKMSKTKGNVIDPIEIIERFGTDAVRFTLASMASPGTDIAFSEARTEGNRAFANKIWNAARFLFMNIDRARQAGIEVTLPHESVVPGAPPKPGAPSIAASSQWVGPTTTDAIESRWILSRLSVTSASVKASLDEFRFDEAASTIYQFFWGDLCDWYLEIVKIRLIFTSVPNPTSPDEVVILSEAKDPDGASVINEAEKLSATNAATAAALTTLVAVFESALRLLSPFMPFLTEEIWHALYAGQPPAKSIALTRYPQPSDYPANQNVEDEMEALQEFITLIRSARKNAGVPEREAVKVRFSCLEQLEQTIVANTELISKLARVTTLESADYGGTLPTGSLVISSSRFDVEVIYQRVLTDVDIPAERERLTKDLAKYEKGLAAAERQLGNESFMAKAPAHIVEGLRKQAAETRTLHYKTKAALEALPLGN